MQCAIIHVYMYSVFDWRGYIFLISCSFGKIIMATKIIITLGTHKTINKQFLKKKGKKNEIKKKLKLGKI